MKLRQIAEPVEFDAFHWALHLRGTGRSAARGAVGLEPLAIRLPDGRAWTYRVVGGELVANAGVQADAGTVVVLDADAFSDFATEVVTVPGLAVMGRVSYDSGSYAAFDAWEPALRSLYHGRPVFDPASVDRAAAARTFRWGVDSTAEIGAQVQRFGFAVVRGVLARHRVAQLSAEIERIRGDARSDDGRSWWVTAPNGSDLVCQLHYTSLESDLIADLERD
ncbi:MAG: hypothetical protein KDB21_18280, partial [Acidimicrobiales bacterium]|nr:hypothetical protein [Acidimicrobiales bacterium]